METKFIKTEDKSGKQYIINNSEIVFIAESDTKYVRIITLNILDEIGNPIKIESSHSLAELEKMIGEC